MADRAAPPSAGRQVGVVRLITRLAVGGPGRQALLLTRALAPEYETTLGAGAPPPDEGELSDPGVTVHRLPLVRPISPAVDLRALWHVRRMLARRRPAILHTHGAKAGVVGRVAALTLRRGPRTVHTYHGHVLRGYFGRRTERAFTEVERRLATRTDVLVAVSAEVRDELLELGVGRPEQYRVIPVGPDLGPFLAIDGSTGVLRRQLGLEPHIPLVGAIGRLVPIKDNATLVAAAQRLPGVHFAVIGDGELRGALEEQARALGVADRVHFTGWASDLPAAVADLDAVVLTSRNEGTPVALIEAAAAGVPAVATDVGGVRSVVQDGVTGLLVAPGNPGAVAAAIERLVADPGAARRMGAAGRAAVPARFGQQRLLDDVRALYLELRDGVTRPPRGAP